MAQATGTVTKIERMTACTAEDDGRLVEGHFVELSADGGKVAWGWWPLTETPPSLGEVLTVEIPD